MDITDIKDYVEASKAAVDLLKSAYAVLPKSQPREEIEDKVRMAEEILRRSDAKLAKELGYNLCKCTFPPQIMLWQESLQESVCSRCGHKTNFNRPLVVDDGGGGSWSRSRRGRV